MREHYETQLGAPCVCCFPPNHQVRKFKTQESLQNFYLENASSLKELYGCIALASEYVQRLLNILSLHRAVIYEIFSAHGHKVKVSRKAVLMRLALAHHIITLDALSGRWGCFSSLWCWCTLSRWLSDPLWLLTRKARVIRRRRSKVKELIGWVSLFLSLLLDTIHQRTN